MMSNSFRSTRLPQKFAVALFHLATAIRSAAVPSCLSALVLAGIFTVTPHRAYAQVNTSTLTGTVSDSKGAVVVGAKVSVTNPETGIVRETITDGAGGYFIPALLPGKYAVSVEQPGFDKAERKDLILEVNQTATLNIELTAGSVAQTVQVTSTEAAIENTDTTLGNVIEQQQVVDLPLNGRQFSQLLQLAPGVVPIDNSQNAGKAPTFGAGAASPGVDGQSNRSNLFFVDGIIDSNPFFGGFSFSPSIDDIQEFKAQSHTDQAEFGQATGAIVSVITRPGTNSFHGSAFEFLRNTVFNTQIKNFSPTPQPKLPYHQNQFGGSFGGPILKDKLFFFANYEGGRQVQPSPSLYTVPTVAERGGDFSGVLPGGVSPVLYDPSTYNPATQTETAFAGNVIPAGRINAGMQAYLNALYPLPNVAVAAGGVNNFRATTGNTVTGDQGSIRVDYNLGTKDIFMGKYSQNEATVAGPSALNNIFATGFNGKNTGGSWVHTYSPTLVSDVVIAYNTLNIPQQIIIPVDQSALFDTVGLGAGWNKNPGETPFTEVPAAGLDGGNYSGFWNGAGPIGPMKINQYTASLSKTAGHHAIKFGGSFYHTAMYTNWSGNNFDFSNKGTWNAACQFAGTNPAAAANCPTYNPKAGDLGGGGDPVAALLLGLPIDATRNLGNTGVNLRQNTTTAFGQDTWAVTPKLTVTYGLRWDYSAPMTEANNRLAIYNVYTHQYQIAKGDSDLPSGPLPANVVLGPNRITSSHYDYFQPRLGLAYQVTPSTVIRVGAGRSYDSWGLPLQVGQQDRGSWPSGIAQAASSQTLNVAGISYKSDGTPVTAQNPFVGTATLPPTPFPLTGLNDQDTKWQSASAFQWNAQVQQQFSGLGTFTLAYVGSQSEHLTNNAPYNNALPSTNTTKIFPDTVFGGAGQILSSWGTGNYESLQADLSRSYANGFVYNATFTWSKTLGLAQGGDFNDAVIQDEYNPRGSYGLTALDIPLVATFNTAYQLPFGRNKQYATSGVAAALLGGWQVNGIYTARSGQTINPTTNFGDIANTGGGTQRVSYVANPEAGAPHKIGEWYNPAAFAVPTAGTFGNAAVNSLRGPSFWNVDASLFRDIPIHERLSAQIRGEAFNLFNHPNYGNPNASFGGGGFNTVTGVQNTNRVIQIAAKILF